MQGFRYVYRSIVGNRPIDAALLMACNRYDAEPGEIVELLRLGGNPNAVAVRWEPGKPRNRATPLSLICGHAGDAEPVSELLRRGAKANVDVGAGWTPLIYAADDCSAAVLKMLIAHGANPFARTKTGSTALHRAASGLNLHAVNLLLECGLSADVTDENDTTPLFEAVRSLGQHLTRPELVREGLPVIKALLKAGADPERKVGSVGMRVSQSALELAAELVRPSEVYGLEVIGVGCLLPVEITEPDEYERVRAAQECDRTRYADARRTMAEHVRRKRGSSARLRVT